MMNEPDGGYEQEPEPMETGKHPDWPEELTPEQRKILERMERKVVALGEQNRKLLEDFHRRTGGRYVPGRLYV